MILSLTPTSIIQVVDGVPSRLWEGVTEMGVPVHALIRCVQPQTHDPDVAALFGRELRELPTPRRVAVQYEMRFQS